LHITNLVLNNPGVQLDDLYSCMYIMISVCVYVSMCIYACMDMCMYIYVYIDIHMYT